MLTWGWAATAACLAFFAIGLLMPLGFLVLGSFMRRYGFFQLANPFTLASLMLFDMRAILRGLAVASADGVGGG